MDIIPLLTREAEGVYMLNAKRLQMVIGKSNQVQVRVGGGFLTLKQLFDEYFDQLAADAEKMCLTVVDSSNQRRRTMMSQFDKPTFSSSRKTVSTQRLSQY